MLYALLRSFFLILQRLPVRSLHEGDLAEGGRAMEVGMVAIDGIPRQKVRFGQFVATLVEIGSHRHAARMA